MRSEEEWKRHWDARAAVSHEVERNGYMVAGTPLPAEDVARFIIDPTLSALGVEEGQRVLEVGCGSGLFLDALKIRSAQAVGVDISWAMVASYHGETPRCAASASHLPFVGDAFDRVLMFGVAPYFPSLEFFVQTIKEGMRVLRSDGAVLCGDLPRIGTTQHYATYDPDEVKELLASSGISCSIIEQHPSKRRINDRFDVFARKVSPLS